MTLESGPIVAIMLRINHKRLACIVWGLLVAMGRPVYVLSQEDICVDEQEALDQCVNGVFELALPPNATQVPFDFDPESLVNNNCEEEKRALEQCLVDNGVNDGLQFCGLVYLPLWS